MQQSNIYEKLSKVREGIKKEKCRTFKELLEAVNRKTKYHRLLPLYYSYGKTAILRLVNMDDIEESIFFEVKTNSSGMTVRNAKRCLYQMAFDADNISDRLTLDEYLNLIERMKEKGVKEASILERYNIESLPEMTKDIYDRCMTVFDNMTGGKA